MKLFSEYMTQLKKLGVYDRATIIIMADHGSYKHSSVGQAPLFMVKFAGSSHPFDVSELPLSHACLQEVLLSALHGELTSMEPWRADGPRYFYKWFQDTSTVDIKEFVINGPVYEVPAVETGVAYHEGTLNRSRAYTPGTTVYFDVRDTARPYLVSGIPNNEGASVWTVGNDAEMRFVLPEKPGALQLTLDYSATFSGDQTVEVWVNDQFIDSDVVSGPSRQTVLIPDGIVTGTDLRLRLHFPDARSPESVGKSGDERLLGVSMKSLVFNAVEDDEE